jgi:alcohol dehydrogenase
MLPTIVTDTVRSVGLSNIMRGAGFFTRLIPIPQPALLIGPGSSARLGHAIASFGHKKLLIVTDSIISKLGLMKSMTDALEANDAEYVVFDEITADAPVPLVEKCIAFYKKERCDAIIAFGGGSSMDAAKAVAASVANNKSPLQLAGYFRGLRNPVTIYAVPTTAGTGSEVTVAAVVSNPATESKVVIIDPRLVPKMAALDPELMTGLPPAITAATGMDALTHAVEAYLGQWGTPTTDGLALSAVTMIFENLLTAYKTGKNIEAREKMALASTYAGLAFTRANVGYVHAIAHQFGGKYHTPHGLANAILLPYVLKFSSPSVTDKLATLAIRAKVGDASEAPAVLAEKFIAAVEDMNRQMNIPTQLDALREQDIPALAKAACWEAHTGYPVPRYMSPKECEQLISQLLPTDPPPAKAAAPASKPAKRRTGSKAAS